jgi:hypothetical protein
MQMHDLDNLNEGVFLEPLSKHELQPMSSQNNNKCVDTITLIEEVENQNCLQNEGSLSNAVSLLN